MNPLITVSLRHQAIYVPDSSRDHDSPAWLQDNTGVLLANLNKLGFVVTEELKSSLNQAPKNWQLAVLNSVREVLGVGKNWTPLVKGWDVPTGESHTDHLITWFVNLVGGKGTELECGHVIPANTFPLERYNGCPFCGTPFEFGKIEFENQGSQKKLLELWTDSNLDECLVSLLKSKTALDATQQDSLKTLLDERPLPDLDIAMKETSMLVISSLIEKGRENETQRFMKSPADVMRYLWYQKTGFAQLVEPRTIIARKSLNSRHICQPLDQSESAGVDAKESLKLKYSRPECRQAASWLNSLPQSEQVICENMHPKRRMWVRFIRALRLTEYSRKSGFEKLAAILKCFHEETYSVYAGRVERARINHEPENALSLLQKKPGLFARSLFSNMLRLGPEKTIAAFREVSDQVPARLIFSLQSTADYYFSGHQRVVSPLGGNRKVIPGNQLLKNYPAKAIDDMKVMIEDLCIHTMKKRFASIPNDAKTIYIEPMLFKMPVSIGERSETVQDLPAALAGMRFPVEGGKIRVFMQWGEGLSAQHLDMDLSCMIAYPDKSDICAYHNLKTKGCKHSGDIRRIPEKIGTAEYIEINLSKLDKAGATHAVFTCNAYSHGSITPELVVGWMNSRHEMKISEKTGVAYDPSCVQHQVRITQSLAKGLVFGVLDVAAKEVVWLEMPFGSQVARDLNTGGVKTLLAKLDSRLNIGNLLALKAEAQGLTLVEQPGADEDYTIAWALNAAEVSALLVD